MLKVHYLFISELGYIMYHHIHISFYLLIFQFQYELEREKLETELEEERRLHKERDQRIRDQQVNIENLNSLIHMFIYSNVKLFMPNLHIKYGALTELWLQISFYFIIISLS